MHARSVVLGLCALIAAPALAAPNHVLTPGMYEITLRTVSPRATPATTIVRCISAEEIETMKAPAAAPADDCQVSGGVAGSVLSYTIKCAARNTESQTRIVFGGDQYNGTLDITTEGTTVKQTYHAKRVGDCPAVTKPEVRQ